MTTTIPDTTCVRTFNAGSVRDPVNRSRPIPLKNSGQVRGIEIGTAVFKSFSSVLAAC